MVNVTPVNIVAKDTTLNKSAVPELYKELENVISRNNYFVNKSRECNNEESFKISTNENKPLSKFQLQTVNQISVFQDSMKIVFLVGQYLGLNPVTGFFGRDISKIRLSFVSWKFLYSSIICSAQTISAILCFYGLITNEISINTVLFSCFYFSTCVTNILCLYIATGLPALIIKLSRSKLDEYTDTSIKLKCTVVSIIFIATAIVLHTLRIIERITQIKDCYSDDIDVLKMYCHKTYPWLFAVNIPYNQYLTFILIPLNIVTVLIWSYPDLFIACISLFLSSIIKRLNQKISASRDKCLPSVYWQNLRQDYNRVVDIIRSFDDVIGCLLFSSFASNLFFVCFYVYYLLSNRVTMVANGTCPNYPSGPLNGYEHSAYFISSVIFMLGRLLVVALFAAEVNSASLTAAPCLYNVPTSAFCSEVQRFMDQIHGDIVALSGLKFFYVTREFVLSVIGTIITYELVLLQLNSDLI